MPRWTDEARAIQAAKIRRWQPWRESTGPRTPQGKAACKAAGQRNGKAAPRLASRDALERELMEALQIMAASIPDSENLRAGILAAMKAAKSAG